MPYCPKCGEEVNESANFCSNCGKELNPEETSSPDKETPKESTEKFKSAKLDERGEELAKELRDDGVIGTDERVLACTRQPRYKSKINPASLIVTEKQVVYSDPEIIGSTVVTRRADEIQDIAIDSGFKNATIKIRSMAMDDLEFEDFPKDGVKKIRDAIRRIA